MTKVIFAFRNFANVPDDDDNDDDDDYDDDDDRRKRKFYGRADMTKVIFIFRSFATAPNNSNNNDDGVDRRRKMKFYISTTHCTLTHKQLIFQWKIDTNDHLKNIVTIENFRKDTYIYSIGTLNMVQ